MISQALIDGFDEAMITLYRKALRRCRYQASYLFRMMAEDGGLQAAKTLLAKPETSSGFAELYRRGAVDLTVEALVVHPRWRSLFSAAELAIAESRLNAVAVRAA